jgi:hypothetical protein
MIVSSGEQAMAGLRHSIVAVSVGVVVAALCAAVPAPAGARPASPGSSSAPYAYAARGLAPLMHRTGAAQSASARNPRSAAAKAARPKPVLAGARAASVTGPQAIGSPSAAAGTLQHNFDGTSSRDSEVTNFNLRFEPPDQGLCAGNGYVLEPVNSAYRIFTPDGRTVRGPFNVNDLFDEGAAEFTSDPRCYYDKTTDKWFATILFLNASFTAGRLDIAVSRTSDPTGLWQQYQIDTTDAGGNGCPCFGDQPRMGIDKDNIYISTDEFSINGPQYNGGQLYAIAKSDLVSGRTPAHFVHFADLSIGGTLAGAIEPAITTGAPGAEYFLNSLDPTGTFDNRLGVWAMTHVDRVAHNGMPVLTNKVIDSEPYGFPPPAEQKKSSSTIDSGDDRMQQTQYIGGDIWGELTTGITVPGDATQRAGAAWFAVRPTLGSGGRLTGASIERQGYVTMVGDYVLYPALQADAAGRAAMVFTLTGRDRYPSAAYAVLPAHGNNFGPISVAAAGTGPYDPGSSRWGDYSFAVLDPDADAVWLATEYVPPKSSQTSTGDANWGTRVFEVGLH